jgi:ATP-dependent RNA helicase DOB1
MLCFIFPFFLFCCYYLQQCTEFVQPRPELESAFMVLQETAHRIAEVSVDSKVELDAEEYVESFKPYMMEVVYEWCQGAKFAEICKMTDVFEGSVIRALRRLEELMSQMSNAARTIGEDALKAKFDEGITKLKRDIVFAPSLYL